MLMARAYTGRDTIMSLKNGYHGMTYQLMGLTSTSVYKYPVSSPTGIVTVSCSCIFHFHWYWIYNTMIYNDRAVRWDSTVDSLHQITNFLILYFAFFKFGLMKELRSLLEKEMFLISIHKSFFWSNKYIFILLKACFHLRLYRITYLPDIVTCHHTRDR